MVRRRTVEGVARYARTGALALGIASSGCRPDAQDVVSTGIGYDATAPVHAPLPDDDAQALDARADAASPALCDQSLANLACWSVFSLGSVAGGAPAFFGGAFDGRYVYWINGGGPAPDASLFVRGGTDPIPRYDTRGSFTEADAWAAFDVSGLAPSAWGFVGAAFDGRYLYLAPNLPEFDVAGFSNESFDDVVVRLDVRGAFDAGASWSAFDLANVLGVLDEDAGMDGGAPAGVGFVGAAFDGRYVYLVPKSGGLNVFLEPMSSGLVARYDTTQEFADAASWTTFDVRTVNPDAQGFAGAAYDGRYLYFAPDRLGASADGGGVGSAALPPLVPDAEPTTDGPLGSMVTRLDTTGEFTSAASWETFDTTAVDPFAAGFAGTAFDGKYVYFAPSSGDTAFHAVVVRYAVQSAFADGASWSAFDTAALQTLRVGGWRFAGAVFDGRYVTFVPAASGTPVTRYDTEAAFGDATSWSTLDPGSVDPHAATYAGAVFDGRFVYLVPTGFSPALRLDVTGVQPPTSPPTSSFF